MARTPFVKAVFLAELNDDGEVFTWLSDDMWFRNDISENFLTGFRGGVNILYSDFKQQFSKLGPCENFKIGVMFGKYFVKKVQIGENILMTVISEAATVDMGQLDLLIKEFETNFAPVAKHIEQVMEQS